MRFACREITPRTPEFSVSGTLTALRLSSTRVNSVRRWFQPTWKRGSLVRSCAISPSALARRSILSEHKRTSSVSWSASRTKSQLSSCRPKYFCSTELSSATLWRITHFLNDCIASSRCCLSSSSHLSCDRFREFSQNAISSSFHEKLYNRGSAHTTLLALGAPPRH